MYIPDRDELLEYFEQFFTYHNPANKNYPGIKKLFDEWYDYEFINVKPTTGLRIDPITHRLQEV